jgi:hypothetical protein
MRIPRPDLSHYAKEEEEEEEKEEDSLIDFHANTYI